MRTLPDSPSLDFLRRQAKDLLLGMRETRQTATLANAQQALARQYGFRTWPELKAEVDRRQGRAELADAGLTQAIAETFALGRPTTPLRSIAQGNEVGRPWAFDTARGRWSVKQLNSWFDASNAETDVRLQTAASEAGIVLPTPVRSQSGAVVACIDGGNWRVNAWIESGPPLSAPVSAPIARQAGAVLARLHNLKLTTDRPPDRWGRPLRTPDEWQALSAHAVEDHAPWSTAMRKSLPNVIELHHLCDIATSNRKLTLSHCALGPANARITRDDSLAILGWEHAGATAPDAELASNLMAWNVGPHGDPPSAAGIRAFLQGYRAEAGDLPTLDLGSFAGEIAAWLNYVYGQLCIALNATTEADRQHLSRNADHLLAHAPSRELYEQVLAT
jgi:Ser/Thr protein kinase RdoA (MazF antagonist)